MMNQLQILHIEDNSHHAELVREIVNEWSSDAIIQAAENGRKGMELLQSHKFDLILLDVNLPDISGIDVLKAVKQSKNGRIRRTPVVMLTTSPALDDYENAMHAHSAAYIVKPVRFNDFRRVVNSIMEFYSNARLPN